MLSLRVTILCILMACAAPPPPEWVPKGKVENGFEIFSIQGEAPIASNPIPTTLKPGTSPSSSGISPDKDWSSGTGLIYLILACVFGSIAILGLIGVGYFGLRYYKSKRGQSDVSGATAMAKVVAAKHADIPSEPLCDMTGFQRIPDVEE